MLQKRLILVLLAALLIMTGCGGGKYAKEETVLNSLTKAMEAFTASINSADTPEAVTQALGLFTGTLEKYLPQMKTLAADHADWETNPPDDLKVTFDKFNSAKAGFESVMPKLTAMAQDNLGDVDLQNAMNKFISVVKDL